MTSALALAGCGQTVGGSECTDPDGPGGAPPTCTKTQTFGCNAVADSIARTPYYHAGDGLPAYPGQALIIESCLTCHQKGVAQRYGAPAGLDFDLRVVTQSGMQGLDSARRLLHDQARVHYNRQYIYDQVLSGWMPPRGFAPTQSQWKDADGNLLPSIRDLAAHDLLRIWLSCGSPVVERTTPLPMPCSADSDCPITGVCNTQAGHCRGVGDVVPARPNMLDPKWSSIYPMLIATSCAGAACHVGGSGGGLSMGMTAASAYGALVGKGPSSITLCNGAPSYVKAGDPDHSLMVWKLEGHDASGAPVCGSQMPLTGALGAAQIQAIRDWITMGATSQ